MNRLKPNLIAIVGPTASGKTNLSIKLAQKYNCEIIAMDSMQIYKMMDIGTAKPTKEEMQGIPHKMLDFVDPRDNYSVAEFAKDAELEINSIIKKGKIPLMVGGTGLYLRATTEEMMLGNVQCNQELRDELTVLASTEGGKIKLHNMLKEIDNVAADKLHVNDVKRVIRAIEVFKSTGKKFSSQNRNHSIKKYNQLLIGLTEDRQQLYKRIDYRVEEMMKLGLLNEVKSLLAYGVKPGDQSMKGIGYKELCPVLIQNKSIDEAILRIKFNTHHYAKRQLTWFNSEKDINWLDNSNNRFEMACSLIEEKFKI